VERLKRDLPRIKLIYLMRHPIDRLMSQYVHELTAGRITVGVREAVERCPQLIDYSRYSMQLQPFLDAFGFDNVLPVFFPRLVNHSQAELERIGRFLNFKGSLCWDTSLEPQNVGRNRLRPSSLRNALAQAPVLTVLRRSIVPAHWSQSVKALWRAQIDPPRMPPHLTARLRDVFDADLAQLGYWMGITLDCENFHETTIGKSHEWAEPRRAGTRGNGQPAGPSPLRARTSPSRRA
jgi:hypothetical protein